MQLAQLLDEEREASAQILVVSVDTPEQSQNLIERLSGLGYDVSNIHFLEDKDHKVIDRYGLFNPAVYTGVAHPATYVVDRQGVVQYRFATTTYTARAPNTQIIEALDANQ